MPNVNDLISLLWKPFIAEINSGGPVYFCFHKDFLNNLFNENNLDIEDSIKLINEACKLFLYVDSTNVALKENALEKMNCGFSSAILLICQQVLAAEEMVRDPNGFSENAYFPRLRRMISPYLSELTQNPYSFEDFEKIWRKLAQEIRSVEGHTKASITFRFGTEQGINKSRSFPLSQALLNQEDLLLLVRKIGKDRLLKEKHENVWSLLRSEKNILRRRAQNILSLPFLKDRIADQAISFAQKVSLPSLNISNKDIPRDSQDIDLKVFKNSLDWLSEEFDFLMCKKNSEVTIQDRTLITTLFKHIMEKSPFLVLPPSEFGDSWIKDNKEYAIEPQETFIVIASKHSFKDAARIISLLVGQSIIDFQEIALKGFGDIFVWEILPHEKREKTIYVRSGKIIEGRASNTQDYEWIGGISLDSKNIKFLHNYLPSHIKFQHETFSIDEIVKINDRITSFELFQKSLAVLESDTIYEILFPNNKKAKLAIGIKRQCAEDHRGCRFNHQGKILPFLEIISQSEPAIVGFQNRDFLSAVIPTTIEWAFILDDFKKHAGEPLNDNEALIVKKSLDLSDLPGETKAIIKSFIDKNAPLSKKAKTILNF